MEELNYLELEKETIDFISKNKFMVLATCANNRVTARMISIINEGLKIFFQTDKEFLKYEQINQNPNVALCISNIQIEGVAKITCHPLKNSFFIENYQKYHQGSFEKYSQIEDNIIIEIEPRLITFWKYIDSIKKPVRDHLDVFQRKAYRKIYEKAF